MFHNYAQYYDAIYSQKDYRAEVSSLLSIFGHFSPSKKSLGDLIEFGCGTGGHALHLLPHCHSYTGVDLSGEMLEIFGMKLKDADIKTRLIRCNLGQTELPLDSIQYDNCVSLFHVFSYMTTDDAIDNFLANAYNVLKANSLLVFDFWGKEGVSALGLERRVKEFSVNLAPVAKIKREVTPLIRGAESCADIMIEMKCFNDCDLIVESFLEKHPMRFFTSDEIEIAARRNSFSVEAIFPEGDLGLSKKLGKNDWTGIAVLRKN